MTTEFRFTYTALFIPDHFHEPALLSIGQSYAYAEKAHLRRKCLGSSDNNNYHLYALCLPVFDENIYRLSNFGQNRLSLHAQRQN